MYIFYIFITENAVGQFFEKICQKKQKICQKKQKYVIILTNLLLFYLCSQKIKRKTQYFQFHSVTKNFLTNFFLANFVKFVNWKHLETFWKHLETFGNMAFASFFEDKNFKIFKNHKKYLLLVM